MRVITIDGTESRYVAPFNTISLLARGHEDSKLGGHVVQACVHSAENTHVLPDVCVVTTGLDQFIEVHLCRAKR